MKTETRFKEFSSFAEYRELEQQWARLVEEKGRLESRAVELREKLKRHSEMTTIARKAKNLLAAITGKRDEAVVEDQDGLFAELREVEDKLHTIPEIFRGLSGELNKMRARLSPGICQELKADDKEDVQQMAKDLLSFSQRCSRRLRLMRELDRASVRFAAYLEPFQLQQFDLDDPSSFANMRLRELVAYSGQTLDGWEDPVVARQPKAGPARKVELLTTMIGPGGAHFKGEIIVSEFADHLIKTKQAKPVGLAALRARLDKLSA